MCRCGIYRFCGCSARFGDVAPVDWCFVEVVCVSKFEQCGHRQVAQGCAATKHSEKEE